MNPPIRRLLRRPYVARAAIVLPVVLGGCFSDGGGGGSCASGGSCSALGDSALGKGSFTYVCAGPGRDAYCDDDAGASSFPAAALPTVAVGAAFSLVYIDGTLDDAGASVVRTPIPAVPALVTSSPLGVALAHAGWYAFLAVEPGAVRDFVDVQAEAIDTLRWTPDLSATALPAGGPALVASVSPLASDGTVLAGALDCSFTSSNPDVALVTGGGREATVQAVGAGRAVLKASCLGVTAQTTLEVALVEDAGPGDSGADAPVADGATEAAGNEDAGTVDGSADAPIGDGDADGGG